MNEEILSVEVTLRFVFKDFCTREDLKFSDMTLSEMVVEMLESEGLSGLTDTGFNTIYNIVSVKEL